MKRILLASFLLFLASGATADLGDDCARAIQRGEMSVVWQIANQMMATEETEDTSDEDVLVCIETVMQDDYDRFVEGGEDVLAARAEDKEFITGWIAWRREELKKLDALRLEKERKEEVQAQLANACVRSYRRDPDETIMNRLCLDIFLETGLPK